MIASIIRTIREIYQPNIQAKKGIIVYEAKKVINQKESHLRLLFLAKFVDTKGIK